MPTVTKSLNAQELSTEIQLKQKILEDKVNPFIEIVRDTLAKFKNHVVLEKDLRRLEK